MTTSRARSVRFEVRAETSASPEQVIEIAGKDFSPRRAEIWPNVRKTRLTVHDRSDGHVEVTEGGTGPARFVWERSRYEWPQPGLVTSTVIDSNTLLPGSTFELRAGPRADGSTVEMILDRSFRSRGWGRIGYALNRMAGERLFASMLRSTLKGVERRLAENAPPPE
ncbi:SRPBCC family protein [Streptomyces sp. NPDC056470]|uniref:SRPBCC family protein n=1 Tax=Streptomyces sp. NPDC056470 TaxID=3345831 RepID=UPI00368FD5E8